MPESSDTTSSPETGPAARAARAVVASERRIEGAALAGFVFSIVSLGARWIIVRPPDPDASARELAAWYLDATHQRMAVAALNLTVIGSIMFLWFVAVIRRRIGNRENPFFGTVFLGSSVLLATIWIIAATFYTVPYLSAYQYGVSPELTDIAMWQSAGVTLDSIVASRLEAVFILATTAVGRLSGIFHRPLIAAGYVIGAILLVVPLPNEIFVWVFPFWVMLVSGTLLVHRSEIHGAKVHVSPVR